MKDWNVIEEKKILEADLFDIYKQKMRGKSGELREYTVVKRMPTISVIPITEDGHIYIVGQERYLLERFNWELMAGFVDKGEDVLTAAKRELKEETGLSAKVWKKIAEIEMSATAVRATSHMFVAKELEIGKPQPEEGEYITVKKVTIKKAVDMVTKGEVISAVSMAGILLVDRLLKEGKI